MKNQDDILPESDGKYLMINVLSRRAKEISRSGKSLIPYAEGHFDPVEVAREELETGKLNIRRRNEVSGELEKFVASVD